MYLLVVFTFHGALSYDVVKQLGVASIHPSTAWTCHYLLLGVAAKVLPQLRTPLSGRFTIWTMTELGLNNPTSLQNMMIVKSSVCIMIWSCYIVYLSMHSVLEIHSLLLVYL